MIGCGASVREMRELRETWDMWGDEVGLHDDARMLLLHAGFRVVEDDIRADGDAERLSACTLQNGLQLYPK